MKIKDLPEPIKSKAIKSAVEYLSAYANVDLSEYDASSLFSFGRTVQGVEYWKEILSGNFDVDPDYRYKRDQEYACSPFPSKEVEGEKWTKLLVIKDIVKSKLETGGTLPSIIKKGSITWCHYSTSSFERWEKEKDKKHFIPIEGNKYMANIPIDHFRFNFQEPSNTNSEPPKKDTVHYFLDKLEEPERTKALENAYHNKKQSFKCLDQNCYSTASAISLSFSWFESHEGGEYWEKIFAKYSEKKTETKKYAIDFINELPEPIKSKALNYLRIQYPDIHHSIESDDLAEAVYCLKWYETIEGYIYWNEVSQGNFDGKLNPILKKEENTIISFLEKLPEPIRSYAIENFNNENKKKVHLCPKNRFVNDLKEAITEAFEWSITPQKHNYWNAIYRYLEKNKFNQVTNYNELLDLDDVKNFIPKQESYFFPVITGSAGAGKSSIIIDKGERDIKNPIKKIPKLISQNDEEILNIKIKSIPSIRTKLL